MCSDAIIELELKGFELNDEQIRLVQGMNALERNKLLLTRDRCALDRTDTVGRAQISVRLADLELRIAEKQLRHAEIDKELDEICTQITHLQGASRLADFFGNDPSRGGVHLLVGSRLVGPMRVPGDLSDLSIFDGFGAPAYVVAGH